jgi:hypothetical protein
MYECIHNLKYYFMWLWIRSPAVRAEWTEDVCLPQHTGHIAFSFVLSSEVGSLCKLVSRNLRQSFISIQSKISGSHGGEYEDDFSDIASRSVVEIDQRFGGAYYLHHQGNDGESKHL